MLFFIAPLCFCIFVIYKGLSGYGLYITPESFMSSPKNQWELILQRQIVQSTGRVRGRDKNVKRVFVKCKKIWCIERLNILLLIGAISLYLYAMSPFLYVKYQ